MDYRTLVMYANESIMVLFWAALQNELDKVKQN